MEDHPVPYAWLQSGKGLSSLLQLSKTAPVYMLHL